MGEKSYIDEYLESLTEEQRGHFDELSATIASYEKQLRDEAETRADLDAMRPVFQEVIDAWQASRWNRADDSQGERMSTPIEHWERVHDAITAIEKVKP